MGTARDGGFERTIHPVRRIMLGAVLLAVLLPASAAAAPVVVLDGSQVARRDDPFVPRADFAPVRSRRASGARASTAVAAPRSGAAARPRRTPLSELGRLARAHAISPARYAAARGAYLAALGTASRLRGTRRAELGGTIAAVRLIAARGALTASRVGPLLLTLQRNRQWWVSGPLLAPGERVEFAGSRLVWEHYPGRGIQLQMLASFGKANALWQGGYGAAERSLLDELVPLAARRAGGLAWEEYFTFDGGAPPWASSITQGTAVQALARGSRRLGSVRYLRAAHAGLRLFDAAPPAGVRVRTRVGSHYLIYSFAPRVRVLNAFIQALVGLFDVARIDPGSRAGALFAAGDREVPHYDTGRWSLYQPGVISSLSYHLLLRDFLQNLCLRTGTSVYCRTAERFTRYLAHPQASARRAPVHRP